MDVVILMPSTPALASRKRHDALAEVGTVVVTDPPAIRTCNVGGGPIVGS
jgi:hypothetical protein